MSTLSRRKIVPDGACLFNSIKYLCQDNDTNADLLREYCANVILDDPEKYNQVYLDRKPEEYALWIKDPVQYGGEIEIIILSEKYNKKINVVDCQVGSKSEVLSYGPESAKSNIFIVYSGRHYDALVKNQRLDDMIDDGNCIRSFSIDECNKEDETGINNQARIFAKLEREKENINLLTRIRKRIKCGGCGSILKDAAEFQEHCGEVEHDDDFAYDCEEIEVTETVEDAGDD